MVARLHAAFANTRLGASMRGLSDGGVYLHQFDGWEDPMRAWKPCPRQCDEDDEHSACVSCSSKGDRISASVVYGAMAERADRHEGGIPLMSLDGGLVLNPDVLTLLCAYGADGATMNNNCQPPGRRDDCIPGCGGPPQWCELDRPLLMNDCRCGFYNCEGRPRPWRPEHLGYVLEQHKLHGLRHRSPPQYHSGYVMLDRRDRTRDPEAARAHCMPDCRLALKVPTCPCPPCLSCRTSSSSTAPLSVGRCQERSSPSSPSMARPPRPTTRPASRTETSCVSLA